MTHRQRRKVITRWHWCKWVSPYTAALDPARQRFAAEAVHGMVATGSSLFNAAFCDAICVALLELRGYSVDEFGETHPGGAVGHRIREGEQR